MSEGSLHQAADYFKRALDLSMPGEFTTELALMRLSDLYRQQGAYAQAIEFIDKAILLRPDEPRYHLMRAQILLCQDQYDDALSAIYEAMVDPMVQQQGFVLAQQVAMAKGDLSAAEKLADLIEQTNPEA